MPQLVMDFSINEIIRCSPVKYVNVLYCFVFEIYGCACEIYLGHFNLILCFSGPTDPFNSLEES